MNKYRAIPEGYMTVGELAKKMNTTVRTLQYYDKEGLLSPSTESEGGRRLYTDTDIITLHHIQSMKHLGFSLDDIKNRLVFLDSPADVAAALAGQAEIIRERIATLTETLQTVEVLRKEVLQMQSVNFKKYADIIVNLQMKNEFYWVIKHFDDKTLDHIRSRFDRKSGLEIMDTFKRLIDQAIKLNNDGILPESEEGVALAKSWWDMIMKFTGGDASLLPGIIKSAENMNGCDEVWRKKQAAALGFLELALEVYFTKLEYNPFEGVEP
jgi:DNA-binding transcriptional MerR regulator